MSEMNSQAKSWLGGTIHRPKSAQAEKSTIELEAKGAKRAYWNASGEFKGQLDIYVSGCTDR